MCTWSLLQKKEYAPVHLQDEGASRGATCFCPHRSFGAPPPSREARDEGGWEGASDVHYNGCIPSLLRLLCSLRVPARATSEKWISLPARPSHTNRRLSEWLNSYLSSRCFVERDYTLLQKHVKQCNSYIIETTQIFWRNHVAENARVSQI